MLTPGLRSGTALSDTLTTYTDVVPSLSRQTRGEECQAKRLLSRPLLTIGVPHQPDADFHMCAGRGGATASSLL